MDVRLTFKGCVKTFVWGLVCWAQFTNVSAQTRSVPVPVERPLSLGRSAPIAPTQEAPTQSTDTLQCAQNLQQQGVEFVQMQPFETDKGCKIADPIKLISIHQTGTSLVFPVQPVLNCKFAQKVTTWLADTVAPIAEKFMKSPLKAISSGPGYVCRNRNNRRGGKLSEHAYGNALDISGFVFSNGARVLISKSTNGTPIEKRMLQALRTTACGYFTTVLGPGSNDAHASHFHLDYAKHGRTWNYRICE